MKLRAYSHRKERLALEKSEYLFIEIGILRDIRVEEGDKIKPGTNCKGIAIRIPCRVGTEKKLYRFQD